MTPSKSRNALNGEIIQIRRGVAIYKVRCSPFYRVRVLKSDGKYTVRSTKETSRILARKIAEELALSILALPSAVPSNLTFAAYADRFIDQSKNYVASGLKSRGYDENAAYFIDNSRWGLRDFFGMRDVTKISSADFSAFMRKVIATKPDMSKSIIGALTATFRNVMKGALDDGVIPAVPVTPKPKTKAQEARPFFRFHPLVSRAEDQYDKICKAIKGAAKDGLQVRGVAITEEFYDLVLFLTNSFLRPTYSELYALKHADVSISNVDTQDKSTSLKTLRLTVRKGKTGYRIASTMPTCVSVYERICARNPNRSPDDYLFFPQYSNRSHAMRIAQNQLNFALKEAGLSVDPYTNQKHTMYSFRHTAICMRLVLSKGEVNIFTLAKNAGTSVEIIENFYAKKLPLGDDLVRNLQSFGR